MTKEEDPRDIPIEEREPIRDTIFGLGEHDYDDITDDLFSDDFLNEIDETFSGEDETGKL